MLHKTRGITLYKLNYNDIYSIVQLYTEEFGPVSYLAAKSKGKKTRIPKSLFYSLSVLDIEVEHQNLRDIQRIKEAKIHAPFSSLLINPIKSAISIFLAEFIGKVVKDAQPNQLLFDYIFHSIQIFDLLERDYANFHLVFMIKMSRFLGFYPDVSGYKMGMFFNMQDGVFTNYKPLDTHFLNPNESKVFHLLLRMNYENMHVFRFSRHERKEIVCKILEYYRFHLSHLSEIKSLEVLHEVFG